MVVPQTQHASHFHKQPTLWLRHPTWIQSLSLSFPILEMEIRFIHNSCENSKLFGHHKHSYSLLNSLLLSKQHRLFFDRITISRFLFCLRAHWKSREIKKIQWENRDFIYWPSSFNLQELLIWFTLLASFDGWHAISSRASHVPANSFL